MRSLTRSVTCTLLLLVLAANLSAREWSCPAGKFKLEGDVVAFDNKLVVVKKTDGSLAALEIDALCKADQEFVKKKEVIAAHKKSAEEMQTWTGKDGLKFRGQVIAYGQKEIVVQRRAGKMFIDNEDFAKLSPLQQKVALKVFSTIEKTEIKDEKAFEQWAIKNLRGGQPKKYPLSGVRMRLETGDEVRIPFFMFNQKDLAVLKPGWDLWLEKKGSEEERNREDFLMRTAAMQYQRDKAENRRIEMIKLDLLGATAGVTDIWRVNLIPRQGVRARPITVMVTAPNSLAAEQIAMRKYRGYVVGGVARASR